MILLPKHSRYPAIALIIILFFWAAIFVIYLLLPSSEPDLKEKFAQMGDAFGVLNSLVGAATIAFALYTIGQQHVIFNHQENEDKQRRLESANLHLANKLEETAKAAYKALSSIKDVRPLLKHTTTRDEVTSFMYHQADLFANVFALDSIYQPDDDDSIHRFNDKLEAFIQGLNQTYNALLEQGQETGENSLEIERIIDDFTKLEDNYRKEVLEYITRLTDKIRALLPQAPHL